MRLKALLPHTVAKDRKLRRGDVFEVSDEMGARLVRMDIAAPTDDPVSVDWTAPPRSEDLPVGRVGAGGAGGAKPAAAKSPQQKSKRSTSSN